MSIQCAVCVCGLAMTRVKPDSSLQFSTVERVRVEDTFRSVKRCHSLMKAAEHSERLTTVQWRFIFKRKLMSSFLRGVELAKQQLHQ